MKSVRMKNRDGNKQNFIFTCILSNRQNSHRDRDKNGIVYLKIYILRQENMDKEAFLGKWG